MSIRGNHIRLPWPYLIACALLLRGALPLGAQQSILKFDRISSEHGLSDNYVNCMLQDRQGLIWFGTRDGLNRYDGYTFTIYRPDIRDSTSISDGGIECMIEDRKGKLWLGTRDGGLNRFDRATGRSVKFIHDPADPTSITAGPITSICEQGEYIWIISEGPGARPSGGPGARLCRPDTARLCRLDTKTGRSVRYHHSPSDPSSLSSNAVTGVVCDRFGTLWVGTGDAGLNRLDPASGGFVNGNSDPLYAKSSTGAIFRLRAGADGRLWLWSYGTLRWLDVTGANGAVARGARIGSIDQSRTGRIYALLRDRSGTLWVGGGNGGAGIMKQGEKGLTYAVHNAYDPYSLGSNRIFCIIEDRSGNIWLGTDKGASKFNHRNWHPRYYQYDPFDSNNISRSVVRSIIRDRSGNLWTATESDGVGRLAPTGEITRYRPIEGDPTSLNDFTANVIVEDSRGEIWVGTNAGLGRLDAKSGRFRRYIQGARDGRFLPGSNVWSVLEDRRGQLWVGTFDGLCTIDRETHRVTYHLSTGGPEGPIANRILCMYEDRCGNIWTGTEKGLSVRYRASGAWRHYERSTADTSGLGNNRVWYIHEDRDGIFWLATSGGGVNCFDPGTGRFTHYTEREGLASNMACGILEDDRGRIWVSTSKGLSMLDRSMRDSSGRIPKIRNYALQDGFYVHEFHFKSCFKDRQGYFYFGGTNGVITFHPDSLADNRHVPNVMLTSFKVFNRETILSVSGSANVSGSAAEIRLPHDSNFFSFSFAALDFTNSRRNQYRYRLEGVDDIWREADGEHPRADYTNVPPGRYTFRVRGSNSDGTWNKSGVSIGVNIEPAYWQTLWFKGSMGLLAAAALATAVMARIRRIRRQGVLERKMVEYQLKALRAQMSPHFISNSLNSILLFMLDHDVDAAHRYLTKFARLMRSTLEHSKSEAVPLAEELEALECYLQLEALRLDNSFTYSIELAPGIDVEEIMIPPMLIQPYAENAIKHGLKPARAGGKLSICIRLDSESIVCSVTDNGVGRGRAVSGATSPAASAAGNSAGNGGHRSRGMSVTRERLEVLSSLSRERYGLEVVDLTGESGAPMGTQVNIRIPISLHLNQSDIDTGPIHDTRNYR
jgi:ligand-binding sensor domain-containing protein